MIAFGFHPAVLNYNGFYTLDGYLSYFSLDYKRQFGKLIGPLMEASEPLRAYFESWGGRAYVYPVTGDLRVGWDTPAPPSELLMDPEVFRQMGGKYVLSCLEVTNAEELGLVCLGTWGEDPGEDTFYTIRVYEMRG